MVISNWSYLCDLGTDFNQTQCSSFWALFHNWIAHLNAVAPQWPRRRRKTLDKSGSDIAVLIFASIQALPEPAGSEGFILLCHNKNNRPMKHPPRARVAGFEIIFSYVPVFSKALFYCVVLMRLYRLLLYGSPWNYVSRMTNSRNDWLKSRCVSLCSTSRLKLTQ